ncbi:hypothetical protein NKOR_01845 [Candidatus Nitrosopumilus koreensis AR1]|uniref:Uncharacterized protein n=1 Tax=Candidatus Nitrosopumilus koreensis AR1 TaxID=1229908 RepID=K0B5P8_9ARCH|nr:MULTISPECIES: hypothetical protein [Nitrosopumilus]AFS80275.1 hypothetical protein NKOR_01845 [Candidatus Nitrosopumilus koreensis AR1]
MNSSLLVLIVLMFSLSLLFLPASAATISVDKQKYLLGDTMKVSGSLPYAEGHFVGLQILNPSKSDLVMIDQFLPNSDGSFSKSYKTQGTKWNISGVYTIKIVYNEQVYEKTFQFEKTSATESANTTPNTSTAPKSTTETQTTPKTTKSSEPITTDPKFWVKGFPDPNKSPNYYLDRYANEPEYKNWFKNTFPGRSLSEIVSYPTSHIEGFPNNDKSPWHYVNRYNNEESYRDWFDSQFPTQSIYDVLDYPESLFQKVPNWVKNNAKWWSSGLIPDEDFLAGIAYLVDEKILLVTVTESESVKTQKVPSWIKNTSQWWADGQIGENEFLKGIEFLIANGIIRI